MTPLSERLSTLPGLRPAIGRYLHAYSVMDFRGDLWAGLTVAIVALPLAMAFAIASGVPPQAGLFTAIVAGFLISALGGTRLSIGGPTGAYIVVLHAIVVQYGIVNLAVATVMAGVMLLVMGLVRAGDVMKFFPMPIITGFTNGIAVIIFLSQIRDFVGLPTPLPSDVWHLLPALHTAIPAFKPVTLALAGACLLLILLWPKRLNAVLPAPFVALIGSTLLAWGLQLPVETVGSRFGGIPQGLPPLTPLVFDIHHFSELLSPAFKIAMLGAIESLLCAVVADQLTGDRHDANQELVAQGIANIASPLLGGIAATGAIARTATNIHNGGRTPVAGIIHALSVLLVMLLAAPLAAYIPLAGLAAILVSVSIKMGDWDIRKAWHYPVRDTFLLALTFALTVLFDLTVAIEIGLLLAGVFFIQRMAAQTTIQQLDVGHSHLFEHHSIHGKIIPSGTLVYRVEGALFFGAAGKLDEVMQSARANDIHTVIVQLHRMTLLDTSGMLALEELALRLTGQQKRLILASVGWEMHALLDEAGVSALLGEAGVQDDLIGALAIAQSRAETYQRAE
ncbi:STAS domain-containing protein [Burkholderiaceae bacterium DAT-1]|nr:STAS domain-containing protein [Burkholderiaceae bacterium DAT-1]